MKRYVLDSNVAATWFLRRRKSRRDIAAARDLLDRVIRRRIGLIAPATWYSDIAATLVRLRPRVAASSIEELVAINVHIEDAFAVLRRAAQMSITLDHRLAETMYHAVAIEHSIPLVTGSASYFRKARHLGHIMLLSEWKPEKTIGDPLTPYRPRRKSWPEYVRKKAEARRMSALS